MKATAAFGVLFGAIFGAAAWAFLGIPGLIGVTSLVLEFCQSFFIRCLEYSQLLRAGLLWSSAALVFGSIFYGLIKGGLGIIRAEVSIRRLPVSGRKGNIILIRDNGKAAFTHGLLRPKVYLSYGLIKSLDKGELKSVILHEFHHKKNLDPLKFMLLGMLRDSFFYIPAVREVAEAIRVRKEHEADDAAVSVTSEPLSLAGALLKAARAESSFASVHAAGPQGRVAERVKRILEGNSIPFHMPSKKAFAVSLIMAALLTVPLAFGGGNASAKECSTDHCAMHINELGADCKTHCSIEAGHRH